MVIVEKMQIGSGGGGANKGLDPKGGVKTNAPVEDHYEAIEDEEDNGGDTEKPDTSKSSSKKKRY